MTSPFDMTVPPGLGGSVDRVRAVAKAIRRVAFHGRRAKCIMYSIHSTRVRGSEFYIINDYTTV